jgi:hypothetical protein
MTSAADVPTVQYMVFVEPSVSIAYPAVPEATAASETTGTLLADSSPLDEEPHVIPFVVNVARSVPVGEVSPVAGILPE